MVLQHHIIFGVDVARYGNDETVIYRNARGRLEMVKNRRGQDLMKTVGDIVSEYKKAVKKFPDYKGAADFFHPACTACFHTVPQFHGQ